jgi:F-type H+-transporting ATPase subunit b
MLDMNPGLILWTIITFVLLLVILRMVAWKPLLGALTAREESIRKSLQEAEEAQQEGRRLLEENRRQLALAEGQSQKIIREGRELGDRLKSEIIDKANASSRQMIDQARDEIRREKDAALGQLRAEVADLAVAAAGKLLDANLDTAASRKLVETAIRELPKS